jgi:hypothetical protein
MRKSLFVSLVTVAMLFTIALSCPVRAAASEVQFENKSDAYVKLRITFGIFSETGTFSKCFAPKSGPERIPFQNKPVRVDTIFYEKACSGSVLYHSGYDYVPGARIYWAHGTNGNYGFYHN